MKNQVTVCTSKTKNKLVKISGGILAVLVAAVTTYAFSSPTTGPGESNSSAGSLISRMAGDNFEKGEHSLVSLSEKTENLSNKVEEMIGKCSNQTSTSMMNCVSSDCTGGVSVVSNIEGNPETTDAGIIQDKRGNEIQTYTWKRMVDGRPWLTQNIRSAFTRTGDELSKNTRKTSGHSYTDPNHKSFSCPTTIYNDKQDDCEASINSFQPLGYLYQYHAAENICPTGWRLPNEDDIISLVEAEDGTAWVTHETFQRERGWRGTDLGAFLRPSDKLKIYLTGEEDFGRERHSAFWTQVRAKPFTAGNEENFTLNFELNSTRLGLYGNEHQSYNSVRCILDE